MPAGSTEALVAQCQALLDAGCVDEALAGLTEVYERAVADRSRSVAAWAANWIGHVHEHHFDGLAAALHWFARAEEAAAA